LYERSVGLLVAMILPVAILCLIFAKWIIIIIAGEDYIEAAPILQIIILATLIQPYIRQFGTTMDSIGKPKINFYLLVFIAVINIGTNYFFISTFGLIGAAFGTLTALADFFNYQSDYFK
jgi:lipopolysaccharide exporter